MKKEPMGQRVGRTPSCCPSMSPPPCFPHVLSLMWWLLVDAVMVDVVVTLGWSTWHHRCGGRWRVVVVEVVVVVKVTWHLLRWRDALWQSQHGVVNVVWGSTWQWTTWRRWCGCHGCCGRRGGMTWCGHR